MCLVEYEILFVIWKKNYFIKTPKKFLTFPVNEQLSKNCGAYFNFDVYVSLHSTTKRTSNIAITIEILSHYTLRLSIHKNSCEIVLKIYRDDILVCALSAIVKLVIKYYEHFWNVWMLNSVQIIRPNNRMI